jgi:hypothetical protein
MYTESPREENGRLVFNWSRRLTLDLVASILRLNGRGLQGTWGQTENTGRVDGRPTLRHKSDLLSETAEIVVTGVSGCG